MLIKRTLFKRITTVILFLLIVGCSEQSLYSGLSEQEANEMVAELSMAGLSAGKQQQKGSLFSVTISPKEFATAVQLLKSRGLPKQRYDTLGEVFAKEGFVSSPLEERARLNHALSQEIASTLSSIDGVILSRVHLAVPPRNDLDDTIAPASASVFIKHRSGVDLSMNVSQIKALVVNGIENLPYDNITVALFESADRDTLTSTSPLSVQIASVSTDQMSLLPLIPTNGSTGMLAMLGLLVLLLVFGARIVRRKHT